MKRILVAAAAVAALALPTATGAQRPAPSAKAGYGHWQLVRVSPARTSGGMHALQICGYCDGGGDVHNGQQCGSWEYEYGVTTTNSDGTVFYCIRNPNWYFTQPVYVWHS